MPKTRISEYSTTNTDNSDIESINISEGCAPSGINNAIRELMVHLKEFQTGASGDPFTVAGTFVASSSATINGTTIPASKTLATLDANQTFTGANTFSGATVMSGSLNSSGANTLSGSQIISGNINSSGTNTFSGSQVFSSTANFTGTLQQNSNNISAENGIGFRNRIINGDMRIDQRNAGAAVTVNSQDVYYPVDRFSAYGQNSDGVYTLQRSTEAPSGFVNSIKATVTTADASLTTTQQYFVGQRIEGTNVSDLAWGTASAKALTLSFSVRSSVTGTFSGAIENSARDRVYAFTYSISSADTWEQKSITIPGDTSGTWLTTTGIGIEVWFNLGCGPDRLVTANTWSAGNARGSTGSVQLISILNATWYITGVQLEAGSVASPFERRPYGTELALCQRYYYKQKAFAGSRMFGVGYNYNTSISVVYTQFPTTMRTAPSALEQSGTAGDYQIGVAGSNITCALVPAFSSADIWGAVTDFRASGLTAGQGISGQSVNSNAYLGWSAEL